jgi:polysaccharide export outer membrane protein
MNRTRSLSAPLAPAWLALLALLLALAGLLASGDALAGKRQATDVPVNSQLGPPDGSHHARGSAAGDYRVGAQDLLEISVFQVPELNRTVRVNTTGDISLPLVGTLRVAGSTVQQVQDAIAAKLTESYLQNPQVSVFVKEFTSQRVTLEGAVAKPGIYPLTGQTTLLQAIAMGSGVTDMANIKGVLVFRVIDGNKKAAVFDLKQIRRGNAEDPLIYGDDIVVVEESGSKSMFARMIKAMPVLGVFSFF